MRNQLATFVVFAAGTAVLITTSAQSQIGPFKNSVALQPTTPGTAQAGHSNITGTLQASQFVGGGAGITGVDAFKLTGFTADQFGIRTLPNLWTSANTFASGANVFNGDGSGLTNLNASQLTSGTLALARFPVPLSLVANSFDPVISAQNNSPTGGSMAIRGILSTTDLFGSSAAAVSGENYGSTPVAVGVRGLAGAGGTGVLGTSKIGVWGISEATDGVGVQGVAITATGNNVGVLATSQSGAGTGLLATNTAGGDAARITGRMQQFGPLNIRNAFGLSIGTNADAAFPIDFPETLGNKISLWGSNPTAHFGLGISPSTLQLFSDFTSSFISFGYGGSTVFTPTVRVNHAIGGLDFRPGGNASSKVTSPYDFVLAHDNDNNNIDSWFRVFNSDSFEAIRGNDGDEAATFFDGAVTANGIDFAEGFKVADPGIEPGDLVVNSGDWEFINRSSSAYQRGVIGVVSTKPAFVAGMSFDAEDKMDPALTKRRDEARRKGDWKLEKALTLQMRRLVEEAYRPVAFMGRVPVKVSGPVKIGDHLTASSIPGVAMAMTKGGHSIGIALEASAGGQTKVMAMIQPGHVNLADTLPSGSEARIKALEAENASLKERLERIEQMLRNRP